MIEAEGRVELPASVYKAATGAVGGEIGRASWTTVSLARAAVDAAATELALYWEKSGPLYGPADGKQQNRGPTIASLLDFQRSVGEPLTVAEGERDVYLAARAAVSGERFAGPSTEGLREALRRLLEASKPYLAVYGTIPNREWVDAESVLAAFPEPEGESYAD